MSSNLKFHPNLVSHIHLASRLVVELQVFHGHDGPTLVIRHKTFVKDHLMPVDQDALPLSMWLLFLDKSDYRNIGVNQPNITRISTLIGDQQVSHRAAESVIICEKPFTGSYLVCLGFPVSTMDLRCLMVCPAVCVRDA